MALEGAPSSAIVKRAFEKLKKATKSSPVRSRDLEKYLGLNDADGHPQTRAIIKEVIRTKNLPLGATTNGYYVIRSAGELKEYGRRLDKRVRGTVNRKTLVYAAFTASNPGALQSIQEDLGATQEEDEDEE